MLNFTKIETAGNLASTYAESKSMTTPTTSPSVLDHELQPYFKELARFESTSECENSDLFRRLKPEVDRILSSVEQENFAIGEPSRGGSSIHATSWNLERGSHLDGIIRELREHPMMRGSDVLLLPEVDYGMARAANRYVARELAVALNLNYVFAPCYLALNKGSGAEADAKGDNTLALHGNALMSRFPLLRSHSLALPNGKDKMRGREKRLGSQRAVIADVDHPLGMFRAVTLHVDAHSSQSHRHLQMKLLLDHIDRLDPALPVVIGGDWNTTTHNSSRALYSIVGFCRRVLMGVRNAVANHYPYPDRWFERHLFRELETRGYNYKDLNVPGECTLHYSIRDLAANRNMGEWVPQWCFWFINWALEPQGGICSLKLDWFTGKGIRVDPNDPDQGPEVLSDFRDREIPLSDHDPITLGFVIE